MSVRHDQLIERALQAIRAVHSDTSVEQEETHNSLCRLRDEASELAEIVREELPG